MKNTFRNHDIRGRYSYNGIDGTFTGIFRLYDDGRLTGLMTDQGPDIVAPGKVKLALGLHDDQTMNFWKLSGTTGLAPLVYVLEKTSEYSYLGKWGVIDIPISELVKGVEGSPPLDEVSEAFKADNAEIKLNFLDRVPTRTIESYLNQHLIESLKTSPNTGELELIRK
ncbi:MAG TPA: hypothetical protein VJI98_01865 [Candidatus Nanoarchaeia archaeon]|nr:hypothetical protein [Candidatus Nanoarchaeia archaeon]